MGALEQKMVDLESQVVDLRIELTKALETITSLERENQQLHERVQELEKRLEEKNNEKKEPLAFVKPNRRKGRRRKRRGSPEGHPGKARPVPEEVDEEDGVVLESCPRCGTDLPEPFDLTEHVVEDIVPAKVVVTRHWTAWHGCPICTTKVPHPSSHAHRPTPNEPQGVSDAQAS